MRCMSIPTRDIHFKVSRSSMRQTAPPRFSAAISRRVRPATDHDEIRGWAEERIAYHMVYRLLRAASCDVLNYTLILPTYLSVVLNR